MKCTQTLFIMGCLQYDGTTIFKIETYNSSTYDPNKFVVEEFEFEFDVTDSLEELTVKHLNSLKEFRKYARQEYTRTTEHCDNIERDLRKLTHQTKSDYIARDDEMP